MAISVLIIDKNIPFIVSLKQALEATAEFSVTLAANPGAADEALRFGSADIAVVDFDLPDMDVMELIRMLRSVQPDLPIVLTPENDLQTERAQFMDVQGILTKSYTARDLIPRLKKIVEQAETIDPPPPEELDFLAVDDAEPFDLGDAPDGAAFNLDRLEVPSDPAAILEEFETMERAQTGLLFSDDDEPEGWQTRVFSEDWSPTDDWDDDANIVDSGTRIFDDVIEAEIDPRTRRLDPPVPEPSDTTTLLDSVEQPETRTLKDTEELRKQAESERQRRAMNATRPLPHLHGDSDAEGDAPFADMDANREFDTSEFHDVLDAVTPSPDMARSTEDQEFHDLVNSMSRAEPPRSHVTRLEALLSSIASDFSDSEPPVDDEDTLGYVLDAIRQGQSPLKPAPRVPDADADDPTIGDVIDGLFDPAFEGVLAALAGEQVDESEIDEPTYENMPDADDEASLQDVEIAAEGHAATGGEPRESLFGEAGEPGEPLAPAPGESATPGPVIIEPPVTAEDSSTYPATTALSAVSDLEAGNFSLDDLLSQIEEQLPPVHTRKPRLKPLPSWKRDGLLDAESNLATMFDRVERGEHEAAAPPPAKLPSSFADPDATPAPKRAPEDLPPVIIEPPVTAEDTRPSSSLEDYAGMMINEYGMDEYVPKVEPLDQDEMYADIAPPPDFDDEFESLPENELTANDFDDIDLLSLDELMERADLPPEAHADEIHRDSQPAQPDAPHDQRAPDADDIIIEPTDAEVEAAFYDSVHPEPRDPNAPIDLTADLLDDLLEFETITDSDDYDDYDDATADAADLAAETETGADLLDDLAFDTAFEPTAAPPLDLADEPAIDLELDLPLDLPDEHFSAPAEQSTEQPFELPDEQPSPLLERLSSESVEDLPADLSDGQPDERPDFLPEPLALDETDLAWFEEAGEFVIPDDEHLIEMPVDEATQRIEAAIVQEDEQEEDVEIAQLAVQLTQYSLESSAQATLLSQNGDLIAYAGEADEDVVEDIFKKIHNAWVNTAIESDSLIRFVSLPDDNEFLVYSTRLADATILSMAFHASTSLSTIRRQAHRLSESLDLIPEHSETDAVDYADLPPAAQTKPSRPTEVKPLRQLAEQEPRTAPPARPVPEELTATYTALWLPNDPGLELDDALADAIEGWIEDAAAPETWSVSEVIAQTDYVSLRLRAPQKLSPDNVIHALMDSTSAYIHDTFPQIGTGGPLWADGYYLVTPARALTDREIMRIMTVQRNAQLNG